MLYNGILNCERLKMTEFEKRCYGMSEQEIRKQYMQSLTGSVSGQEMVVMGILSDCQELLGSGRHNGMPESIRKNLNIAKFILAEMMENREIA
jgi:hypothetical protein